MSEIRATEKDGEYYYSNSGYVIPIKPKTRTVYSYEERKHNVLPDYTLEQCQHAENEFNRIRSVLAAEYGDAFIIEQVSNKNRIATIIPKELREIDTQRNLWGYHTWVDLALFNLSLQSGATFNFPVQKLNSVFKINFSIDNEALKANGNKGFSVDETLTYFAELKTHIGNIFAKQNVIMSNVHFAKIIAIFKMHSAGIVSLNVEEWVKYVEKDYDLNLVAFGFNRRMFASKGINFLPAEQVEEYKGLPIEWVERMLAKES